MDIRLDKNRILIYNINSDDDRSDCERLTDMLCSCLENKMNTMTAQEDEHGFLRSVEIFYEDVEDGN